MKKKKQDLIRNCFLTSKYAAVSEEIPVSIPCKSDLDKGSLQIWYIEKMTKQELPKDEYGIFYASNCYLILYTVEKDGFTNQVIFSFFFNFAGFKYFRSIYISGKAVIVLEMNGDQVVCSLIE